MGRQPGGKRTETRQELSDDGKPRGQSRPLQHLVLVRLTQCIELPSQALHILRTGSISYMNHHNPAGGELLGVVRPETILDSHAFQQAVAGVEIVAHVVGGM